MFFDGVVEKTNMSVNDDIPTLSFCCCSVVKLSCLLPCLYPWDFQHSSNKPRFRAMPQRKINGKYVAVICQAVIGGVEWHSCRSNKVNSRRFIVRQEGKTRTDLQLWLYDVHVVLWQRASAPIRIRKHVAYGNVGGKKLWRIFGKLISRRENHDNNKLCITWRKC